MTDRARLIGFYRYDIQRAAIQGKKLDFIGSAIAVNMNDCAYITGFKTLFGNIAGQNRAFVFLDHLSSPSSGYAVTRRGACSKEICTIINQSDEIKTPSVAR